MVHAAWRVLTYVLKTMAQIARNQTASHDRGGQTEKRTSFDLAHKLPLQNALAIGELATA